MLKYKAAKEGKVYQEIGRFFPSSKTCHGCLGLEGNYLRLLLLKLEDPDKSGVVLRTLASCAQ